MALSPEEGTVDYELTDAHKLIRDTARRIARERVAPRAAAIDEEGEDPHDVFAVFREAGLPGSAAGETKGAFCLTEPNVGSDAAALESRARRDGDDYVLDGEKAFISGGSVADFVVAFARVDGQAGPRGSDALLA